MSIENKMPQETQQQGPNLWSDQLKPVAFKMVVSVRGRAPHHLILSAKNYNCLQRNLLNLAGSDSKLFFQRHWKFGKVTWSFAFVSYPTQRCRTLYSHNLAVSQNIHTKQFILSGLFPGCRRQNFSWTSAWL